MSTLLIDPRPEPQTADAAERMAALDATESFLVEAPAGSGKTGLLVQRMLKLLCRVDRPESVLALTFTNKATAEMRERVLRALDLVTRDPASLSDFDRLTRNLAADLLRHDNNLGWSIQGNSHRLNIRTIDSLCGEITRNLPLASGGIGQMEPVEKADPLYRRAARAVILRLGGEDSVLNDALRTVLLHQDADLQRCEGLLAGMLATREQWGNLIPLTRDELADTYLEEQVRPRLNSALQSAICGTLKELEKAFPADVLRTLTELAMELAGADGYRGAPNPIAACAHFRGIPGAEAVDAADWALLARLVLSGNGPFTWRRGFNINQIFLNADKQQKQRLKDLVEALDGREDLLALFHELSQLPPPNMPAEDWHVTKALFHLLHFALLELQLIFQREAVCDFTERSLTARAALRTGEARDRMGNTPGMQLEHLLVDEMQDTSSAQYELLETLTQGWDGHSQTVFLVGDPKQSIYLFRQARVERFVDSLRTGRLGQLHLTVLRLTSNFRSAPPLVARFNGMFAPIFAEAVNGSITYTPASAAATGPAGQLRWHVDTPMGDHNTDARTADRLRIRKEQAEDIAKMVLELRSGVQQPPTTAILVRSREHAAMITRKLKEANVPFRGVELEPLDERPEVLDTIALTRALLHPADRVAWLAVLRAPWCGATLADLHLLAGGEDKETRRRALRTVFREKLSLLPSEAQTRICRTLDVLDRAVANLGRMPIAVMVERASFALGADLFRTDRERTNVRRCLELIETAEAELKPLEPDDLQRRLSQLYAEPDNTPDAVEVMTIHKAKGLEWDVVFVPELQRSSGRNGARLLDWLELPEPDAEGRPQVVLAPIAPRGSKTAELGRFVQSARKRQEEAEVARLLYVVVTRARTSLHLYAAPDLRKADGSVSLKAGTLLCAAWPGAANEVQAQATEQCVLRERQGLDLSADAEDDAASVLADLADLKRVPDAFDLSRMRTPLHLPWLHASASVVPPSPALEEVLRPEGAAASRAVGNAVHLFLQQLARRFAAEPGLRAQSLHDEVLGWSARICAVLRGMGVHGATLEQHAATVQRALTQTLTSSEGVWLLQPHPSATEEEGLLFPSEEAPLRTLRLDRSFLAGTTPGSVGTSTLWIVDYKTAFPRPAESTEAFLSVERDRYAPQLRNYARLRAQQPGTPASIMLALFYPALPALDSWSFNPAHTDL